MAERRMFAKTIIDSDAFLEMPLSSQALYFHLAMRADDDGFLNNAKKISRLIGANQNDYDLLKFKRFILEFEDGICVIKHWRMHNYIQKDRYKSTVYEGHKKKLYVKENNAYSLNKPLEKVEEIVLDTVCVQDVSTLDTQCVHFGYTGKDSIGKDSIGNNISHQQVDGLRIKSTINYQDEFDTIWKHYPRKIGKPKAFDFYKKYRKTKDSDYHLVLKGVQAFEKHCKDQKIEERFIPHGSTWFNQQRWLDDLSTASKGKNPQPDWYDDYVEELKNTEKVEVKEEDVEEILMKAKDLFK